MKKYGKLIVVIAILILAIVIFFFVKTEKQEEIEEYIPEEEITDEENRKTIVSLYFQNKETKKLEVEARMIDSKVLLKNPYEELIKLLIEGSKDEKLEGVIPQNVKLQKAVWKDSIVTLSFSKEFFENTDQNAEAKMNCIYSIVNTLTELKEVNGVQFTSEDKDAPLENGNINWKEVYTRTNQ